MSRGWVVDPTAEHGKDWATERFLELCAVGGCGNAARWGYAEIPSRLGGHDIVLETALCDYHHGWYDAQ